MAGRVCRTVLVLLAVVATVGEATMQDPVTITRRDTYWVGAGLGAGSEDFAAHLNGSYQFGANLISLRIASTAGLFDIERTDYALLYGRATRGVRDRHLLSAAVGVALVDGCGIEGGGFLGGCQDQSATIGLPFEFQASYRPGKLIGIGLYGFANLNRQRSFAGLTLGFQVGRLR